MDPRELAALRASQRFLVAELERAGVFVRLVDAPAELVEARFQDHVELLVDVGGSRLSHARAMLASHKGRAKEVLARAGISVPKGGIFRADDLDTPSRAAELGFPLVLKPTFGSNGQHVRIDLRSVEELRWAVEDAEQTLGPGAEVVIEEQFEGLEHRVFITERGEYAVMLRQPPEVVGDGRSTIAELADAESFRRTHPRSNCAGPIVLNDEAERFLHNQGLTKMSVPEVGQRVRIRGNSNLSSGATGEDVTDRAHRSVLEIALAALDALGLPLGGVDFLCKDITQPQSADSYRILEVNPLPGIGMHLAPSTGRPRAAARAVVEVLFPELATESIGLVPIRTLLAPPPEALVEETQMNAHHPIIETCFGLLQEKEGAFSFGPNGLAPLEAELSKLRGEELAKAVVTVVQFATFLKDKNGAIAGEVLKTASRVASPILAAKSGPKPAASLQESGDQLANLEGRGGINFADRAPPKPGQAKAGVMARFELAPEKPGPKKKR
ncbi:MAG: hypothetical protein HY791_21565 [Deltaproteobacteria bacterium]|nr:hypothetical protein [Deltaproteobacteria bacterium]